MRIATLLNAILMSLCLWGIGFVVVTQVSRMPQAGGMMPELSIRHHAKAFIHLWP